ncbi:MAG: 30S ribosomal protein S12 methylthiotransferase RimO [Ruminococcaceae bacterium]|nr:30S ribosomal protein S12 methylthiotransferase RimO [Oscillospiraceae bacterium]
MKTKVFVVSLGCSKNHCDLENMMGILVDKGYEITLNEYEADVALVNTCGFIESAKEEAISNILEMAELKETGNLKALVVSGCLSQRYKDEILDSFPEVDAVVGVFDFDKIDEIINNTLKGKRACYLDSEKLENFNNMPRIQTTPFYTAYLKIAEGCDNRCSYCAIPKIRGRLVSRELNSLIKEATRLAQSGVKELILVAQDTTRYGVDLYGEPKLCELLYKLSQIDGIEWIRIHYMYPEMITEELLNCIKENKKVLHYFDIPIQHINSRILKLMNRRSDRENIESTVNLIRKIIPDATIRTTVIVGFPTESEEEFLELYSYIDKTKFDRLGVFAFSKEEGTGAYNLKGQIPKKIKLKRQEEIQKLQAEIMEKNNKKHIGQVLDVLVEGYHNDYDVYFGRSKMDSVEIDGTVMFETDEKIDFGEIVKVKITNALEYDLIGELTKGTEL